MFNAFRENFEGLYFIKVYTIFYNLLSIIDIDILLYIILCAILYIILYHITRIVYIILYYRTV